jgi:hypothetical protein
MAVAESLRAMATEPTPVASAEVSAEAKHAVQRAAVAALVPIAVPSVEVTFRVLSVPQRVQSNAVDVPVASAVVTLKLVLLVAVEVTELLALHAVQSRAAEVPDAVALAAARLPRLVAVAPVTFSDAQSAQRRVAEVPSAVAVAAAMLPTLTAVAAVRF